MAAKEKEKKRQEEKSSRKLGRRLAEAQGEEPDPQFARRKATPPGKRIKTEVKTDCKCMRIGDHTQQLLTFLPVPSLCFGKDEFVADSATMVCCQMGCPSLHGPGAMHEVNWLQDFSKIMASLKKV